MGPSVFHWQIGPWNLFCDKLGSGIFFATNWAPESFFAKNWAPESFLRQIEPAIFFATNCTPESFLQIGPGKIGRRQNEPWLIGPRQIIGSRMFNIESKCTNTLINTYQKCCNSILAVYIQCKCIHWVQGLGKCILSVL